MKNPKVVLLAGLGYGDEGKGTTTEFFCHKYSAHTVVRYNGGGQCGHNVVRDDGQHHVFSQFGSGTFLGVKTHLSRFMLVNPFTMEPEAAHLRQAGVRDPYGLLTVERQSIIVTPYHRAINRLKELARGDGRHGSCGAGIGEARSDQITWSTDGCLTAGDLGSSKLEERLEQTRTRQLRKLEAIEFQKIDDSSRREQFNRLIEQARSPVTEWMSRYRDFAKSVQVVGADYLPDIMQSGTTVFEGAQGVLLDETHGFQPYTTWTDTTFNNADILCASLAAQDILRVGITRTHSTRHGAGPFVSEDKSLNPRLFDEYNTTDDWQGGFRVGPLDLVALRYAMRVIGPLDGLAVTHCDRPIRQVCDQYVTETGGSLEPGPDGSKKMMACRPVLRYGDPLTEIRNLGTVLMTSHGPRLCDKEG